MTDDANDVSGITKVDFYAEYGTWKKWDETFTFDKEDAEYFRGETRGVHLKNRHVLEIGFGSGSFIAWAEAQGATVAGVEITPLMVKAAEARGLELLPPNFETKADLYAARFALIAAFDVFEHLDQETIISKLRAAATMLADDGALLLRYPNSQSPFGLGAQHGDVTHVTALSEAKIEQLAAGTGLVTGHYAGAYRILGGGGAKIGRLVRYILQDCVSRMLNAIWGLNLVWAPVVTQILRKE